MHTVKKELTSAIVNVLIHSGIVLSIPESILARQLSLYLGCRLNQAAFWNLISAV
jgi:hypothetical protein